MNNVAVVGVQMPPFGERFAPRSIDTGRDGRSGSLVAGSFLVDGNARAVRANISGGLNAKGRPPGATRVAQCVELFALSRGEAVDHVDGARVALAHNVDGPTCVRGGDSGGRTG